MKSYIIVCLILFAYISSVHVSRRRKLRVRDPAEESFNKIKEHENRGTDTIDGSKFSANLLPNFIWNLNPSVTEKKFYEDCPVFMEEKIRKIGKREMKFKTNKKEVDLETFKCFINYFSDKGADATKFPNLVVDYWDQRVYP